MALVTVRYEQAVYGSFPFWDKGYAILARSPGCRDEWLASLRAACQRYGERPQGAADAGGLIVLKLASGPWAIIRPSPQGTDDRGRPGALAFHALFLSGTDYRKAGAFPFAFARFLRDDWTADTTDLPAATVSLEPPDEALAPIDPRARAIAEALSRGRRVALESPGPIDDLARQVWLALPLGRRSRLTLATWIYALGDHPDLVALPRLTNIALDRSYIDPANLTSQPPERYIKEPLPPSLHNPGRLAWLGLGLISIAAIGFAWRERPEPLIAAPLPARTTTTTSIETHPPRSIGTAKPLRPAEEKRIAEGLFALAERFGTLDTALSASEMDPYALMKRLRERMVYRDAVLTPSERESIAASADPDRERVLAWHDQILAFRLDRPLPDDFDSGPLDWQVRTLAWSFHLDPGTRPAEEIPRLLAERLAVSVSTRPTPLASVYPALADYARFLRRLPPR